MTVRQLKSPCFELTPNPWPGDGLNPHYATWHEADEALRELRAERGPDPRDLAGLEKVQAKANPAGCWAGECDGCLDLFTDEETDANHYGTRAELDASLPLGGWAYQDDTSDKVFCAACKPAGAVAALPPPSPAELEAAGQMRLIP